jgi:hypothetical protein
MNAIYQCKCGCLNTADQITKINVKTDAGNHTVRVVCKKHPTVDLGALLYRVATCVDCVAEGKDPTFEASGGGKFPRRCPDHRRKRHNNACLNHSRNYRERAKSPEQRKIHPRGEYCLGFYVCATEGNMKCGNCGEFVPIFRGVDPLRLLRQGAAR